MSDRFVLLLVQGMDEMQEQLFSAAIKQHADGWWHEFSDCWIVEGSDGATQWRDRLQILFGAGNALFFAFELPDRGYRAWASLVPKSSSAWIKEHYSNRELWDGDPWATEPTPTDDPWAVAPPSTRNSSKSENDSRAATNPGSGGYDDEPPF